MLCIGVGCADAIAGDRCAGPAAGGRAGHPARPAQRPPTPRDAPPGASPEQPQPPSSATCRATSASTSSGSLPCRARRALRAMTRSRISPSRAGSITGRSSAASSASTSSGGLPLRTRAGCGPRAAAGAPRAARRTRRGCRRGAVRGRSVPSRSDSPPWPISPVGLPGPRERDQRRSRGSPATTTTARSRKAVSIRTCALDARSAMDRVLRYAFGVSLTDQSIAWRRAQFPTRSRRFFRFFKENHPVVDFTLTDEQKALREMAHDFAEKEIRPVAWEYDKDGTWPEEIIEKAWEVGLMNTHIPRSTAGPGLLPRGLPDRGGALAGAAPASPRRSAPTAWRARRSWLGRLRGDQEEVPGHAHRGAEARVVLPDRAGRRLRRLGDAHHAPSARATSTSSTARSASSPTAATPTGTRSTPRPTRTPATAASPPSSSRVTRR